MGERFRYREVSWPEEARHAQAALAANEAGGEWDFIGLKDVLLELDISNLDMELSGFELSSIENLMNEIEKNFEAGSLEDQGKLDEKTLVFMECPHCSKKFEKGQARVLKD